MGIKNLTKSIQRYSPNSITHENLHKLSGKRVAVDASLIIYQQLMSNPKSKLFTNSQGKVTNHITGLFYKIMNYISLNITLVFVFDGKPPDNKQACINQRKQKSEEAKELCEKATNEEEKHKYHKASLRLTKEMIQDCKILLDYMGIDYIHPQGEAEAYASELCRIGYVDYVLSEDMDSLVYGCPKLIRKCIDRSLKRNDIVSIFDYSKILEGFELTPDQFIDFCILCGCDYCDSPPKIGPVSAYKLLKKFGSIQLVVEKSGHPFPENYLETFYQAKENFHIFTGKIDIQDIEEHKSQKNEEALVEFLTKTIEMNPKRVQNALKKYNNTYQQASTF